MGSPENPRDRYFATYDWAGIHVRWEVTSRFEPWQGPLLDVGAGWPKYRELLAEYDMDAVEAWQANVEAEGLDRLYRNVYVNDVADVRFAPGSYRVGILGDVLEHMVVRKARVALSMLLEACDEVLVVVPFEYEQGVVGGNPYEVHHQDDLTPEVMADRYPELRPLAFGDGKGLYGRADA